MQVPEKIVCLIVVSKLWTLSWIPYVDISFGPGLAGEVIGFLVAWVWCGLLFYSGYRVARCFRDGYRSVRSDDLTANGDAKVRFH